jgi:hypothetical protein
MKVSLLFDVTAVYSSILLIVLPLVGCFFIDCQASSDNHVSVSKLVSRPTPLTNAFSFYGSLFLFCVLYFQTNRPKNLLTVLVSILAKHCLSVPLVVSLSSVPNDIFHELFAGAGVLLEFIFNRLVISSLRSSQKAPKHTSILIFISYIQVVTIAVGLGSYWISHTQFQKFTLIACEYVFGVTLMASAKLVDYFQF